ncbi:MAG TPA: MFS transporter [Paracoccus sp. (in: a-proteobacteria)]|uniref:MFS transporter n=1 Tax=Paracoccus sp. TaxID=267 RepID=UPI002C5D95AC|nr:MFS transporter [Paracoccus sp. (in: a-proteobacteria)]HWL56825.1 MFS transporter [Paracoccus sp. (in: a-proteobacteria)]
MNLPPLRADRIVDESPIGRQQLAVFIGAIAVLVVDGFDLQIISYLIPAISQEWGMAATMKGAILSAGLAGLMVGYLLLPLVAVRIGLRRMILLSLLSMSAATFLTLLADTPQHLVMLRFLTGLTLGGVFPNTVALITEYCPEKYRSSIVSISYVGLPLGFLVAGWSAYAILPQFGWRGAIAVGGILPLLAVGVVLSVIPESLEYLLGRAKDGQQRARKIIGRLFPETVLRPDAPLAVTAKKTRAANVLDLFAPKIWIGTLALWVSLASNSVVYYFVLSWMPSMLITVGATQQNAILAASLTNGGGILAAFITGPLMDRYGTYPVLLGHFIVAVIFTAIVGAVLSPDLVILVPAALCLGFCVSGLQKGISALTVRFYSIDLRAVGLGWVFGVARLGAIAGPILASFLFAADWEPHTVFYVMTIPLLIGTLAVALMGYIFVLKARGAPPAVMANQGIREMRS